MRIGESGMAKIRATRQRLNDLYSRAVEDSFHESGHKLGVQTFEQRGDKTELS
jgi:hypothetical protein